MNFVRFTTGDYFSDNDKWMITKIDLEHGMYITVFSRLEVDIYALAEH